MLVADKSGNLYASGTIMAVTFSGDGSGLTGVVASGAVAKTGDAMTGALTMSGASAVITFDNAGGDLTLAGGTISDIAGNVNVNDNVYVTGNVGIGIPSPTEMLEVSGNIQMGYEIVSASGNTASCSAGGYVVGGGGIASNAQVHWAFNMSYPSSNTTWTNRCVSTDNSTLVTCETTYVICARIR